MKPEYEHLPYRAGVGLLILNENKDVFVGERFEQPDIWQLPQGGIDDGDESFEKSVFRELEEETGITSKNSEILGIMDDWQYYDLPDHLIAKLWDSKYRGQKQKWVAVRFTGKDSEINLHTCRYPEFQDWKWVPAHQVINMVIPVKRGTYETVFEYFNNFL